MKVNSSLSSILVAATMILMSFESSAQQAPGYAYPQAPAYPPAGSAPQYQQPPPGYAPPGYQQPQAYQQPQGYAPPNYPPQGYAQPGQTEYVSPTQFLPTFGRKFGSMFRRLFYGDAPPPGYSQPVPGYGNPQQGGRLDQPPQGYAPPSAVPPNYNAQPGYPPRYETAPAPRKTVPAMPPTSRLNSGSTKAPPTAKKGSATSQQNGSSSNSKRKYTPPSITPDASKSKIEEEPPPAPEKPSATSEPYQLPGSKPATAATGGSTKNSDNATASSGSFLRGKKSNKEGRVISPYPPYRELDVSGLSSGSLALDPTTQKVFEVP